MIAWDPKTLPWDWDTPFPNVWQHGSDMEIPGETLPPQTFLTMNAASAVYASNGSFPKYCNMLPKELDCKTPNSRNMAILDLCSSQQEGFPSDMGDCNLAQGRSISMQEGMLIEGQHLNHGSKAYSENEFFPNQCIMLSKHKELDCKVPKSRNMVNLDLSNDQQEGFRNQLDCKTPSGRNMANLDLCSSQQEGFPSDMGDCNVAQGRSISMQEGMLIEEQHLNHGSNAYSKHGLSPNQCIILSKHKELVCKEPKSRNMVNLDLSNDQGEGPSDVTDCHATGGRVFLKQEGKLREEQHHDHWSEAASGFSGESSICLELGKRTYFVGAPKCGGSKAAPKSVPANPVKKSRLAASGIPHCQVEGCKMELTSAKNYHRRHKVCEMHSKSAVVVVAGQEQRFCQQCSRFHVLLEFDECKRSCRRRLAGHNERRRKPQPDLLTWNRGSPTFQDECHFRHFMTERQCLIHHQGLSNMSSAQETPKESRFMRGNFIWPKVLHFGNQSVYDCPIERQGVENNYIPSILPQQMNNRSPVLQSQKFMLPMSNGIAGQTSLPCVHNASGPTSRNIVSPSVGTSSCRGSATAAQNSTRVSDSGCALSLLSSQGLCPDASASVSLNPLAQSIMTLDEWIHKSSFEGQIVQEQQHRMVDQTTDKLMPVTSLSQSICMSSVLSGNGINTPEKEHYAQLFMQDLSSARNLENRGLKEYQGSNSEDVKLTRDLVHLPLLSQNTQMHEPFRTFQLGDGDTVELETLRAYESPIFACHQML